MIMIIRRGNGFSDRNKASAMIASERIRAQRHADLLWSCLGSRIFNIRFFVGKRDIWTIWTMPWEHFYCRMNWRCTEFGNPFDVNEFHHLAGVVSSAGFLSSSCHRPIVLIIAQAYVNGLVQGKNYRKTLYFMGRSMVSCKFSLKPISWLCKQISVQGNQ